MMPPGNEHGFSDPAQKLLARLSLTTGWWDLKEIMEGRGNLKPCFLFRRIAESETDTLYEYRANEGTVIRTKVPNGVNYRRTGTTGDTRGIWVPGNQISCSQLLIDFVYAHASYFPNSKARG
jgi:hypothetical protein